MLNRLYKFIFISIILTIITFSLADPLNLSKVAKISPQTLGHGVSWPNPRFVVGRQENGSPCPNGQYVEVDRLTGVMWQKSPLSQTYTWSDAQTAMNGSYCGYTDWRLPNTNELESLINNDAAIPGAWLNTHGFANFSTTPGAILFWTSNIYTMNANQAWYVDFGNGGYMYSTQNTTEKLYVLPVRGGQ